jgi:hypothetical protein
MDTVNKRKEWQDNTDFLNVVQISIAECRTSLRMIVAKNDKSDHTVNFCLASANANNARN